MLLNRLYKIFTHKHTTGGMIQREGVEKVQNVLILTFSGLESFRSG